MKDIRDWTKEEFENLPYHTDFTNSELTNIDSLIILPNKGIHQGSRYRQMDFVVIKDNKPICRVGGISDVLHIGGIGGYNGDFNNLEENKMPIIGWAFDCLPKSRLIRIFCPYPIRLGASLSSFEIFANISNN